MMQEHVVRFRKLHIFAEVRDNRVCSQINLLEPMV